MKSIYFLAFLVFISRLNSMPAIWNDNAKQFMREAAEKVQLHCHLTRP